jgi:cell division protease FtsH
MDGFAKNEGVIVIAATNRPDVLDRALLRPGRFDRQIVINLPDVQGREGILKVHGRNKHFEPDVDFGVIARTTAGFSGADLENILNEAALLAARQDKKSISMQDIQDSIVKVMMGVEKKNRRITDKEKKLTAVHEAGHAIVAAEMPNHDKVHEISIIPRGMAGGYTMHLPSDDKFYQSKGDMEDEIVSLLGGRVAEMVALDDISTGASNDIQRATEIARKMVTKYGMSDKLGPIVFGSDHEEVFLGRDFATSRNYSEQIASLIDEEVKAFIEKGMDRAKEILTRRRALLDKVSETLLEKEKIDGAEFEKLCMEIV